MSTSAWSSASATMQVLVCILLLSLTEHCSSQETLGKVVFANILYRHGHTSPIKPYPNDPYKNESSWSVPFGQLTNIGKNQHLILGRWLRNRYSQLLSPEYSAHDIYVLSTDDDRTLMSAEANLAGLYPPSGAQVWDINEWMPIPVHSVSKKRDNVFFYDKKYCKRYSRELERVQTSPEMKKIDEENSWLYEYLSTMTGGNISSLETVGFLYDTLYAEEMHNKTLPLWTRSVYPDRLKSLATMNFEISAHNTYLQRVKSGSLLNDMVQHMQLKSKDELSPNRKLWIYSTYDYTIANMMMALGVFEPHCPPYAATLLIELRINVQKNYVVTIFYKNSTEEPTLLTLRGCVAACPFDEFVRLTEHVIHDDWWFGCEDLTFEFVGLVLLISFVMIMTFLMWFMREWFRFLPPIDEPRRVPQQNENLNPVVEIILRHI